MTHTASQGWGHRTGQKSFYVDFERAIESMQVGVYFVCTDRSDGAEYQGIWKRLWSSVDGYIDKQLIICSS